MGATRAPVDKAARQDLILRVISERELGTQQGVVEALAEEGVEAAQATVSRDLAELGVLKVGNRYLALPHEPGSAGIEVLPSFVLGIAPAQNQVVIHTRDGTAGAVSSVLDRVKGLKIMGTIAGQDTVLAIAPDNASAEEIANLIADVCRARTRPAGNAELGLEGDVLEGKKVVLAYSGGLDTSVCLKWLEERGATPYALYVDLGQGEPAGDVRNKAIEIGAAEAFVRDAKVEFARAYVAPAIRANALYGGKYPLFTALGRPLIARKLVEAAREVGATHIAHGSTGKGNDQVRFDVTSASIAPDLTVVAPVRDWNMNRPEEIEYAREHGIPVPATKESPYSVDANLWGRSIEAGPLEDPDNEPAPDVFELTAAPEEAPDVPLYVEIGFDEGLPTSLDGEELPLVELILRLNDLAGQHGVGRIDMIEDRLVGIKSREVYEAPAALTIIQAHRELETITLTKDVLRFKASVEQRYAELTYDGLWFTPLKAALDAFMYETQKTVTGTVRLKLFKGSSVVVGRSATQALYSRDLATYDPYSTFDEASAAGFITLWGLPARQWASVNGGIEGDHLHS